MNQTGPTLLHLSDLHCGAESIKVWDLVKEGPNKGLWGLANLRLNPERAFPLELRQRLLEKVMALDWDICLFSGDLTNVSQESEFLAAKKLVDRLATKGRVLLTAGNHDRYTRASEGRLERCFAGFWPYTEAKSQTIPRYDLSEEHVLLELDMAVPQALFSSRGRVRGALDQVREAILACGRKQILVMGHYPIYLPRGISQKPLHQLENMAGLGKLLLESGVRYYLHGHLHKSWCFRPSKDYPLVVINSGGGFRHEAGPKAGCHLLRLGNPDEIVQILP